MVRCLALLASLALVVSIVAYDYHTSYSPAERAALTALVAPVYACNTYQTVVSFDPDAPRWLGYRDHDIIVAIPTATPSVESGCEQPFLPIEDVLAQLGYTEKQLREILASVE